MSLNEDMVILRSRRSTSQVSVYNYPEHLNPFYEDDQHKRLRFWKMSKKDEVEKHGSSFSLSGLKDSWVFKSFKLKKKSSTLGISKTSESPPPIRRDIHGFSTGSYVYDRRNVLKDTKNFDRDVLYRSSLQNVHSFKDHVGEIGFHRNSEYRSTIQCTKVDSAQNSQQKLTMTKSRRSSQSSVLSSNPFDTDNDEDIENADLGIHIATMRTPRKKRRAPTPPVLVHKESGNESMPKESSQKSSKQEHLYKEENISISNLTAEIESFVNTTNSDNQDIKLPNINTAQSKCIGVIPEKSSISKTTIKEMRNSLEKSSKAGSNVVKLQLEPEKGLVECIHVHVEGQLSFPEGKIPNRVTSFRSEIKNGAAKCTSKTTSALTSPPMGGQVVDNIKKYNKIEELKITEDPFSTPIALVVLESEDKPSIAAKHNMEVKTFAENHKLEKIDISNRFTNHTYAENYTHKNPEVIDNDTLKVESNSSCKIATTTLKIIEPNCLNESILQSSASEANLMKSPPRKHVDELENLYRIKQDSGLKWKESTLAPLETNMSPMKRKSVKDIIESINRSQRLLNAGATKVQSNIPPSVVKNMMPYIEQSPITRDRTTPLEVCKFNELNINFDQNQKIWDENQLYSEHTNNDVVANVPHNNLKDIDNVPRVIDSKNNCDPQKLNNAEVFKKCHIKKNVCDYRETSPTASNLDWNPVPKPKRTKNLSET